MVNYIEWSFFMNKKRFKKITNIERKSQREDLKAFLTADIFCGKATHRQCWKCKRMNKNDGDGDGDDDNNQNDHSEQMQRLVEQTNSQCKCQFNFFGPCRFCSCYTFKRIFFSILHILLRWIDSMMVEMVTSFCSTQRQCRLHNVFAANDDTITILTSYNVNGKTQNVLFLHAQSFFHVYRFRVFFLFIDWMQFDLNLEFFFLFYIFLT